MKNFTELNLSELLAQSVAEMGFTTHPDSGTDAADSDEPEK